jgi:hypothetical protein
MICLAELEGPPPTEISRVTKFHPSGVSSAQCFGDRTVKRILLLDLEAERARNGSEGLRRGALELKSQSFPGKDKLPFDDILHGLGRSLPVRFRYFYRNWEGRGRGSELNIECRHQD